MSDTATTPYSSKCAILAELWLNYRVDEEFSDFIEYNDLGLPIAYAISNNIVKSMPMAEQFINETFDLLLVGVGIEDTGFESLEDILSLAEEK
jgi:hypothetical protein